MHLAVEMIRETSIVVESAEIGAADVTDLQFLVARRTRGVGEGFQVAFALVLGLFRLAQAEMLVEGTGDATFFAEDAHFDQACVDGFGEVGDLFQLFSLRFM